METPKVIICVGRYELLWNGSMFAQRNGELGIEIRRPMDLLFPVLFWQSVCPLVAQLIEGGGELLLLPFAASPRRRDSMLVAQRMRFLWLTAERGKG